MWSDLIKYGIEADIGVFGVLFIMLLATTGTGIWWVMRKNNEREERMAKRNEERENRYIEVIDKQAEGLQTMNTVAKDVSELKDYMMRRGG